MNRPAVRCLILACGNTLRSDDGIGLWLAQWADDRFRDDPTIRVISRQQWTADLAEDISHAESVLFIDCSIESLPGSVGVIDVEPSASTESLATHHQGAPELLALAGELYHSAPSHAVLFTVGAGSTEFGEEFSQAVLDAIPLACAEIERTMAGLLQGNTGIGRGIE